MSAGVRHGELHALFGFAERQLHVYKRYWVWEVVWLFYSLVSVLSIGYLASGLDSLGVSGPGFDLHRAQLYLLIGALLWGYLSLVFMEAAYAIAWERWEGTIEYTFMAPVRRVTHLFGICLFAIGYGLARTSVVLVVAIAMFGLDFSHADILAAVAVLAASTVPLIGLGILTAVLPLLSPQKGEQSIRSSLLDASTVREQLPTIGILLAMGVVLIPVSVAIFSWAENRAKRLGLLKRSG